MKKTLIPVLGAAAVLAVCLLCFAWFGYRNKTQDIPVDQDSAILTVSWLGREDGVDTQWSLTRDDIPEAAADELLDCVEEHSMTYRPISAPQTMTITDPYIYISIWIENEDLPRTRVNLSNQEGYCVVKYGEKCYGIVDSAPMLEQVKSILTKCFVS